MKKITLLLLMLISGTVFAQTEISDVTASAKIITALKIVKDTDMHLGTIAPLSNGASTFVLKTDGTADALTSTATDIDATGRMAATFTITGDDSQTFGLTVPADVSLTGAGPAMTLTLDPDLADSGNSFSSGSATLNIGGSLALASGQDAGTYSGTFTVSVNYE